MSSLRVSSLILLFIFNNAHARKTVPTSRTNSYSTSTARSINLAFVSSGLSSSAKPYNHVSRQGGEFVRASSSSCDYQHNKQHYQKLKTKLFSAKKSNVDTFGNEADDLFQFALSDQEEAEVMVEEDDPFGHEVEELFEFMLLEEEEVLGGYTQEKNVTGMVMDDQQQSNTSISESANLIVPNKQNWTLSGDIRLAPASEIAYFFLQNTIGLSEELMWRITTKYGSILGFTVLNLKQKISLLRRTMNLSDDDVRTIICKQPSILHLSADGNVSPTISFLVRSLNLSKDDLRVMVVQYPAILCYSIKNLRKKISFFLDEMGYGENEKSITQLRNILVSEPRLLTSAVTSVKERMKFLHKEMGIPISDLRGILVKNPRILLYSLIDNLQVKLISLFVMRLGMEKHHILKIMKAYPNILDYNLEDHLLPIMKYFILELDFSPSEFRGILLKFPRLMTYSLFKIKHVVGYLRFTLGMNAKQVKRVLFQAPQVISLSTDDTLVSKVNFLSGILGADDSDDLRKVLVGMPTLLLCSIENNLRPKVTYLLQVLNNDEAKLQQVILTLPTLLGYSLEKRIKPRMKRIIDASIDPIKITVGITMKDEGFEKWLGNKVYKLEKNEKIKLQEASKRSPTIQKSSSIILRKRTDQDEKQQRDGRIIHWKR